MSLPFLRRPVTSPRPRFLCGRRAQGDLALPTVPVSGPSPQAAAPRGPPFRGGSRSHNGARAASADHSAQRGSVLRHLPPAALSALSPSVLDSVSGEPCSFPVPPAYEGARGGGIRTRIQTVFSPRTQPPHCPPVPVAPQPHASPHLSPTHVILAPVGTERTERAGGIYRREQQGSCPFAGALCGRPRLLRRPGSSPLLWWAPSGSPLRAPRGPPLRSGQRPPAHPVLGLRRARPASPACSPGPAGSSLQRPPLAPRGTAGGSRWQSRPVAPSLEPGSAFPLRTSAATRQAPGSAPLHTLRDGAPGLRGEGMTCRCLIYRQRQALSSSRPALRQTGPSKSVTQST